MSTANSDLLDESIFGQLEELQDESQPDFVEEVINLYCETSEEKLEEMDSLLKRKDLDELAKSAHSLKGSSANIGAVKVVKLCADLKTLCEAEDLAGCKQCLEDVKTQFKLVREHLKKILADSKEKKKE
eukprot:tig00000989_g6085.t1